MVDTWTVSVGGRNYGPYTAEQMRSFAVEGRLAPHSLVCRQGEATPRQAREFPELAALFRPATERPTPGNSTTQPSFGRSSDRDDASSTERAQFVIIADLKSGSVAALEGEIFNLGPAFAVLPQVWIVSCEASVNAIRNALVQKLGKRDLLFVVDATHNKAAWFNFGPEADARIRRIWTRTESLLGRRAAE